MGSIPVGSTKHSREQNAHGCVCIFKNRTNALVRASTFGATLCHFVWQIPVGRNILRQSNPSVSARRSTPKLRGGFPYGVIIFSAKLEFSVFDRKFYFSIFAIISSATFASIYGGKTGQIYSAFSPSDEPININTSLGIEQQLCL